MLPTLCSCPAGCWWAVPPHAVCSVILSLAPSTPAQMAVQKLAGIRNDSAQEAVGKVVGPGAGVMVRGGWIITYETCIIEVKFSWKCFLRDNTLKLKLYLVMTANVLLFLKM